MKTLREEYREFADKILSNFKELIKDKGDIVVVSFQEKEDILTDAELITYITNGGINRDVYLLNVSEKMGLTVYDNEEDEIFCIGFGQLDSMYNKITVIEEVEEALKISLVG